MATLTDKSKMPWGKHRGKAMEDIPASYLLWLYNQTTKSDNDVMHYIRENLDVLEKEVKEKPYG